MAQTMNQTHGFTLIELLVTMAIVGILSSISVANYSEFKEKAYVAEIAVVGSSLPFGVEAFYADRIRGNIPWPANDYDGRPRVHANIPGMVIPPHMGVYMRFARDTGKDYFSTFVCSTKVKSGSNHFLGWRYRSVIKNNLAPAFNGTRDQGFVGNNLTASECRAMQ